MRQVGYLYLLFILFSNTVYPKTPQDKITSYPILSLPISSEDLMINADKLYHEQKFSEAIKVYEKIQEVEDIDEINALKK